MPVSEGAARFAALVARPDEEIPLDEAALLIAAEARPDVDVAAELGRLDELAAGCKEPTLDGLTRHLFTELGFRGNTEEYQDPDNSYLDQVIRRRRGGGHRRRRRGTCSGRPDGEPGNGPACRPRRGPRRGAAPPPS